MSNKVSKLISICATSEFFWFLCCCYCYYYFSICLLLCSCEVLNEQNEFHATDTFYNETIDSKPTNLKEITEQLRQTFEVFEREREQHKTGRSYVCIPLFRIFNLELRFSLNENEAIAVSGDHATLGQWQIGKAQMLKPINTARTRWYLKLWLCASQRIYYRYFIYEPDGRGQKQIRHWEAQPTPRMLQTYEIYRKPGLDIFGEAHAATIGGGIQHERGWLRHEYIIELKFIWLQRPHINFINQNLNTPKKDEKYRLHLETLHKFSGAIQGINAARIEVARYAYNRSKFRMQNEFGVQYTPGGIVIFRITQPLKVKNVFKLLITAATLDRRAIGEVYIFPSDLRGSRGVVQSPIYSTLNGIQIGGLALPYLIVQPLPEAAQINLRASFHRYWPLNWPTMDIAQRGAAASFYQSYDDAHYAPYVENTIQSFRAVPAAKGDMVEFDVQLTRDYVPVIWHSFGFYTAPAEKRVLDRFDLSYVLIKDLSYEELKATRVFVSKHWLLQEVTHLNVKNISHEARIFPTLAEVYQSLPKTLGLLIEIKWPQLMASGGMEAAQTLNKNQFVNEILQTSAKYGCGRALIFSSFDADICTMVRLKQNAFPAVLMSTGKTQIWDAYMDLRTQSFRNAIQFVQSADILGSAMHVDNFLLKPHALDLAFDLNQAIFIWGNDLRSVPLLEQFRALDVSGLIYDGLDLFGPRNWKRASFFEAAELLEIFGAQCITIGNSTKVPGIKPPKPTLWPKL